MCSVQLSCLRHICLTLIVALNTLIFSNVEAPGGSLKQGLLSFQTDVWRTNNKQCQFIPKKSHFGTLRGIQPITKARKGGCMAGLEDKQQAGPVHPQKIPLWNPARNPAYHQSHKGRMHGRQDWRTNNKQGQFILLGIQPITKATKGGCMAFQVWRTNLQKTR